MRKKIYVNMDLILDDDNVQENIEWILTVFNYSDIC